MAGAAKNRQQKERKAQAEEAKKSSSDNSTSPTSSQRSGTPPERLGPPSRYDGNRDPEARPRGASTASVDSDAQATPAEGTLSGSVVERNSLYTIPKNLDVGAFASWQANGYAAPTNLPVRPLQHNKTGRDIAVKLNTWHVTKFPSKPVYQWDVLIGSGTEKRGLITRVWNSKQLQKTMGPNWIFDGNRIAWSITKPSNELRQSVNLDEENNKPPRTDKKTGEVKVDLHRVVVKFTKQVPFETLRAYFSHNAQFDNSCLEAINFLDHLMRESPSKHFTQIKRSFFPPGQDRFNLGGGIEALKGVYASFRSVNTGLGKQPTLSVTVDVANGTFWIESSLINAMKEIGGFRDYPQMSNILGAGRGSTSQAMSVLRPLKRLRVYTRHIEKDVVKAKKDHSFVLDGFTHLTAKQKKFKNRQGKEVTIAQYFKEEYGIILQHPDMPLAMMTKMIQKEAIHIPVELLWLNDNQRYSAKLSDRQTTQMIKFAVTLPDERWKSIDTGIKMLDWASDKNLAQYGVKISADPVVVKAKLLPNPKVGFAKELVDPRASGRWDLKGKKFIEPHKVPLKSWGVAIMPGRSASTKVIAENFIREFVRVFSSHGGVVANKNPVIMLGTSDAALTVEALYKATGTQSGSSPQLLVFIVPDKTAEMYNRLKKSADCRYGVVSQVLQSAHVEKAQAQYCSNVCMKVNAKLGGITARAHGLKGDKPPFNKPTMIIGADVSHGAPGTEAASIAAMTMSWDKACIRYAAAVETNGSRVEMITKQNIDSMLYPLFQQWLRVVSNGFWPEHVLYFRDGVSEGQYAHVLNQEVHDIRAMMLAQNPKMTTKFTVVVASKRHHVRFFPEKGFGDRNNNPQPGTLVETGITHPFEYDFYLCAHSAIKGTARPVHYHVLLDEAKMGVEELQNMIYEASYQYVRSTTPVSMFPAVYYAHLASNRGLSHIDAPSRSGERTTTASSGREPLEIKKLLAFPESAIRGTMWYI